MVGLLHSYGQTVTGSCAEALVWWPAIDKDWAKKILETSCMHGSDRVFSHYPQHGGVRGCAQPASSIYVYLQGEVGAAAVRLKAQRN